MDWSATSVGAPEQWPTSLQTMVGTLLRSLHPMFLWWGDDLVQFYNDAYLPSFGDGRHPQAMGQQGRACWPEIWHIIGPQIEAVRSRGESCWSEDALVPIHRNGRLEEVYWSYGYSPVFEQERVGGVLVVCTETTPRVLGERRQRALRALAVALPTATTDAEALRVVCRWCAREQPDVPFAVFYHQGKAVAAHGLTAEQLQAIDAMAPTLGAGARRVPVPAVTAGAAERLAQWLPIEGGSGDAMLLGVSDTLPFDAPYDAYFAEIRDLLRVAQKRLRAQRDLLMQAPVAAALLVGPDYVFTVVNPLYRAMVGRDVLGKAYFEAFPELRGGPMDAVMRRVYALGEDYATEEMSLPLAPTPGGATERRFFRFSLKPVRDEEDGVYGMMAVALDIHDQVMAKREAEAISDERARLLADARAAARAKDEFLAVLGHELRNPLAPILTALSLMDLAGVREGADERAIIARQARHLTLLVDDLLDVSRVAQGKIALRRRRVLLRTVVAGAVEIASPMLEAKRHEVRVDVVPSDLAVDADELRLRQVVANLLTNAARYTPANGRVRVRVTAEDGAAVIVVEDNGLGIEPATLPHLFDAFFQGPGARDRGEGGLGLGLALVKALTELHGGTTELRSEGLGKGTTATVRLPLPTQSAAGVAAPLRSITPPPMLLPTLPKVLLVDDNTDLVELFAAVLRRRGFEVMFAYDGPTALRLLEGYAPGIAVLDIGLPEMDGYELARRLRSVRPEGLLRCIAMSGFGQEGDRARSLAAGFSEHLVKPVEVETLIAAILAAWTAPSANA